MRIHIGQQAIDSLKSTDCAVCLVEGTEPESVARVLELAEPLVNDLTIWTREDTDEISIFFC